MDIDIDKMSVDNSEVQDVQPRLPSEAVVSYVQCGPITHAEYVRKRISDVIGFKKLCVDEQIKLLVYHKKNGREVTPRDAASKKRSYVWEYFLHVYPKCDDHNKRSVACKLLL